MIREAVGIESMITANLGISPAPFSMNWPHTQTQNQLSAMDSSLGAPLRLYQSWKHRQKTLPNRISLLVH